MIFDELSIFIEKTGSLALVRTKMPWPIVVEIEIKEISVIIKYKTFHMEKNIFKNFQRN